VHSALGQQRGGALPRTCVPSLAFLTTAYTPPGGGWSLQGPPHRRLSRYPSTIHSGAGGRASSGRRQHHDGSANGSQPQPRRSDARAPHRLRPRRGGLDEAIGEDASDVLVRPRRAQLHLSPPAAALGIATRHPPLATAGLSTRLKSEGNHPRERLEGVARTPGARSYSFPACRRQPAGSTFHSGERAGRV
jgi:hypothetical protein